MSDLIKRKDGSYSPRGLWDNIRANKGSGKKPTKEMLAQERKIKKMQDGGKLSYEEWKKKYNLKETNDYKLKRAWELGYVPDAEGHLPTIDNQTLDFLKSGSHPTIKKELEWYNSPEGAEFKNKYQIDSTKQFWKYRPVVKNLQTGGGILDYIKKGISSAIDYINPFESEETAKLVSKPVAKPIVKSKPLFSNELKLRQSVMESHHKPSIATGKEVSPKGAKGLTQIMPSMLSDFQRHNPGVKINLSNPKDAKAVQDWALDYIAQRPYLNKPNQDRKVYQAKVLAAYNWGPGNMKKFLGKQKSAGVDIYNSLNWVEKLPKEPRNYIKGILLNKLPGFQKQLERDTLNSPYNKYYNFGRGGMLWFNQKGGLLKGQEGLKTSAEATYNPETDTYDSRYSLPELTVTGKAPRDSFGTKVTPQQLSFNQNIHNAQGKALGTLARFTVGGPQQAIMYGLTGKAQYPSEAMRIENPVGATATDIVTDPLVAGSLVKAGVKGLAKSAESGLLSNAWKWKINPLSYKKIPWEKTTENANKSFRAAGLDALEDFKNTRVLRSQRILPENATFLDKMKARTTGFPSFQKGYADLHYLPKEGGVIFETSLPTFKRGEINPITGKVIKGRHYAHRVINPETGETMTRIPASEIIAYNSKPHWLRGYKPINTPKVSNSIMRNAEGEIQFLDPETYRNALVTGKKNVVDYLSDPKYKNVVERNQELANRLNMNRVLPIQKEMNNPSLYESRIAKIQQPLNLNDPRKLELDIINNNSNVGAQYTRNLGGEGSLTVPRLYSPEKITASTEHEVLHHIYPNLGEGFPSFTPLETAKAKSVFKPAAELRKIEEANGVPLWYLDDVDELVPNSYDLAKDLGIKKFQKYPGMQEFKKVLDSYSGSKSFVRDALKLNTPRDYKRAWDMLSGVRLGITGAMAAGTASQLPEKKNGGVITDPRGQWAHPGKVTTIPGNDITMKGVPYPVFAETDKKQQVIMQPEQEYHFPGAKSVTEYPMPTTHAYKISKYLLPQHKEGGTMEKFGNVPYDAADAHKKPLSNGLWALPFKNGGQLYGKSGIHIKPENRGKFTASANRAGMGVQAFASKVLANKEKYSPTLVKRANFARNAAKWKHQFGGSIDTLKMALGGQMGSPKARISTPLRTDRSSAAGMMNFTEDSSPKARMFEGGDFPNSTFGDKTIPAKSYKMGGHMLSRPDHWVQAGDAVQDLNKNPQQSWYGESNRAKATAPVFQGGVKKPLMKMGGKTKFSKMC